MFSPFLYIYIHNTLYCMVLHQTRREQYKLQSGWADLYKQRESHATEEIRTLREIHVI